MNIQSQGYQDGSEALAVVEAGKPDFMLTNYLMEPMEGIAFVRALRSPQERQSG